MHVESEIKSQFEIQSKSNQGAFSEIACTAVYTQYRHVHVCTSSIHACSLGTLKHLQLNT